jgi:hypothetical protein
MSPPHPFHLADSTANWLYFLPAVDREEMTVTLVKSDLQLRFSAVFSNVLQFSVSPGVDSVFLDSVSAVLELYQYCVKIVLGLCYNYVSNVLELCKCCIRIVSVLY